VTIQIDSCSTLALENSTSILNEIIATYLKKMWIRRLLWKYINTKIAKCNSIESRFKIDKISGWIQFETKFSQNQSLVFDDKISNDDFVLLKIIV
jgi:hypothetical protein